MFDADKIAYMLRYLEILKGLQTLMGMYPNASFNTSEHKDMVNKSMKKTIDALDGMLF